MILARIDGHATASIAHPSFKGQCIVLCTPIDEQGKTAPVCPLPRSIPLGGGLHARVFITTDGSWTQDTVKDDHFSRSQSGHGHCRLTMKAGRVIGTVTMSDAAPQFRGARWLLVCPMGAEELTDRAYGSEASTP